MKTVADWQMQDALKEYEHMYVYLHGHTPSETHWEDLKLWIGADIGKVDLAVKNLVSEAERRAEARAYLDEGDM